MILDDILAHKHIEIAALRERYADWRPPDAPPVRRDFPAALRRPGMSLIAEFKRHPAGPGPDGEPVDTPYYTVNYDFRLRPAPVAASA
jgi:indole-3-glycerol phosphate synthase